METCQVCCGNLTVARKTECSACKWICCRVCVQRYLLEIDDDANCMHCHNEFSRMTLLNMTSKAFVNGPYKNRREQILEQREKAMMSGDTPYVTQEIQKRQNVKLYARILEEKLSLKRKLRNIDNQLYDLSRQMVPPLRDDKRQFVHKCPIQDCRGFLSSAWKCNVCEHYICPDCNADKGVTRDALHECDEAERQTMQLLKNDSRKCPGCAEYIYKISGCDQMWCTACHTAFSWRTGRKVNDVLHNPHFYAWQQSQQGRIGREHGDIPCGGMPTSHEIWNGCKLTRRLTVQRETPLIVSIHRLIVHTDQVERHRYRTDIQAADNRDLRISYILKEMSDEKMKSLLQQREKASSKRREIGLILTMLYDTSSDILRQFVTEDVPGQPSSSNATINDDTQPRMDMYTKQLISLIEYANTSLSDISMQYNCVVPFIDMSRFTVYSKKTDKKIAIKS